MPILPVVSLGKTFADLIDAVQSEPVRFEDDWREAAYVRSLEDFHGLTEAAALDVNPAVARLRAESAERWAKAYEALAK